MRTAALLTAVLICTGTATAQPADAERATASAITRIAPPADPDAIALYPGVAPGSEGRSIVERWARMGNGETSVRNVTRPTLTPFLPDPAKATGAAVIVAPGGAFKMLSMDNEGWPVARWLAAHGIAAFVLKYRLNETPDDEAGFMREIGATFTAAATGSGPGIAEPRATQDAQAALRMVRAGA
jgi:acetyl esterase/lipase